MHYRVLHEPPDLNGCPPRLRALIEPCLAKQPADRPQPAQILQYCLQYADMTAGPVPAQASYPATEIAANRRMAPPPTMVAGVGPQSPLAGAHRRVVPPRPIVRTLIYLGSLLAVCGAAVAVIAASPSVRTAMHLHGATSSPTATATGPCTPKINAAGPFGPAATQTVEITGSCFGVGNTASGNDTAYFRISDLTAGWNACWTGDPNTDFITCGILSWTNQKITFNGFSGLYGQSGNVIADGDHIKIQVWNSQSDEGPATYEVVAR